MPADGGDAEKVLQRFAGAGIDVDALAATLQIEGARRLRQILDRTHAKHRRQERGGARIVSTRIDPLAGQPAPADRLVDVPRLITAYFSERPDPAVGAQRVAFGTSGHRGTSFELSFNESHVLAITQAICDYRRQHGIDGPLFIGFDTHALSTPAFATALEVLAGNGVEIDDGGAR